MGGTVGVLHVGTAAVAYDVLSIRDIVKYPIDKSAAVQSIGSICVGGGVAVRPYLGELAQREFQPITRAFAAAITARSARPAACAACLAVTRAAFAAF